MKLETVSLKSAKLSLLANLLPQRKISMNWLSSPQELDISRNQLAGFEEDFAVKLLGIDDVRFEQNPFVCDVCHIGPMLNHLSMVIIR